jgi:hypothetical protein
VTTARDLAALLAELHDDPLGFFRLVLKVEPRRWQARGLAEIGDRLRAGEKHIRFTGRCCHGAGKTMCAAGLGIFWTATRPGCRGVTLATTWTGVADLLWVEIAKLYRGSLLAQAGVGRLLDTSLTFADGWDLTGLSSNENETINLEGRHGAAALRIVDEARSVRPAALESTEGLLDAPETCDIWITVPSIPSGPFFDRDTKGKDIVRAVVTIDDLVDEGLDGKAEWRARRLEEWGENSPEYQSRCLARYVSDAEGALFPFSWVERAMTAADFEVDLSPVAGLDPAGSVAGDQTAFATISGPDLLGRFHVRGVTGWHERDTQASKGLALMLVREAGADVLAVDTIGVGKGLSDSIRQDFPAVVEFRASDRANDPTRYVNRKAEIAWELRRLLEGGLIRLPKDAALRAQLVAMKYEILSSGKIRVVDPSDSPDLVDAVLVALSVAAGGRSFSLDDLSEPERPNYWGQPTGLGAWDAPTRSRWDWE